MDGLLITQLIHLNCLLLGKGKGKLVVMLGRSCPSATWQQYPLWPEDSDSVYESRPFSCFSALLKLSQSPLYFQNPPRI